MPWQTTGSTVGPSTNTYSAGSDGDGLTLVGSFVPGNPKDVGLKFSDQTQPIHANLGFASGPNAWMMGLVVGDVILMSVEGRVHLGCGPGTVTPQLMISNGPKSPDGREGLYLKGSINFTGDPNVGTGEFIASERDGSKPNPAGLDLYTDFEPRLTITQGGSIGIGTRTPNAVLDVVGDLHISGNLQTASIKFADGSVQTTATLKGETGDTGRPGPPGAPGAPGAPGMRGAPGVRTTTSAICGPSPCNFVCGSNLVAQQSGNCTATADTGSCSATIEAFCCVCHA